MLELREQRPALEYRRGLFIRGAVSFAFFVYFVTIGVFKPDVQIDAYPRLILLLGFMVAVNPFLWWLGARRNFPAGDFYAHWTMDIVAVALVIHYLGGIDVPIAAAAYMVMIVSSATFATMKTSWLLALLASVSYAGVIYGEGIGYLSHYHVGFGSHVSPDGQILAVAGTTVFFFIFAYLAGTLANQLREQAHEVRLQKQTTEDALTRERQAHEGVIALARIVQHDVYGPLGVLSAACKEMQWGVESGSWDEVRRWMEVVEDRLRSIEGAVETLGAFSDDSESTRSVTEVYQVVTRVVRDLEGEWRERGIRIELSGEWPRVDVSRGGLYHVFRNLLTNAIKTVPQDGSGVVNVVGRAGDDGKDWTVSVSDNGPGLPEPVRSRMGKGSLEPLRMGGYSGTGFGIGLALSQFVANRWDGCIEYRESDTGGSVFLVRIPPERVLAAARM